MTREKRDVYPFRDNTVKAMIFFYFKCCSKPSFIPRVFKGNSRDPDISGMESSTSSPSQRGSPSRSTVLVLHSAPRDPDLVRQRKPYLSPEKHNQGMCGKWGGSNIAPRQHLGAMLGLSARSHTPISRGTNQRSPGDQVVEFRLPVLYHPLNFFLPSFRPHLCLLLRAVNQSSEGGVVKVY